MLKFIVCYSISWRLIIITRSAMRHSPVTHALTFNLYTSNTMSWFPSSRPMQASKSTYVRRGKYAKFSLAIIMWNAGVKLLPLIQFLPRDAIVVMRCPSVCLSVRLSRSWIMSKRINISSYHWLSIDCWTCEQRSDKNSYRRPRSVDRTVGDSSANVCLWRPATWTTTPKRREQKRI